MNWTISDFAVAAALLAVIGGAYALLVRLRGDVYYRAAAGLTAAASLFMVWVALAVGAMGEPGDAPDLMYMGVLALGIGGAVVTRGRPRGMAATLLLMVAALVAAAGAALALGVHRLPNMSVLEVLGVNAVFAAPLAAAALLFRHSAKRLETRAG